MIKTDHPPVAKITNLSTGQLMSLSQTAVKELIAAMSFSLETYGLIVYSFVDFLGDSFASVPFGTKIQ